MDHKKYKFSLYEYLKQAILGIKLEDGSYIFWVHSVTYAKDKEWITHKEFVDLIQEGADYMDKFNKVDILDTKYKK